MPYIIRLLLALLLINSLAALADAQATSAPAASQPAADAIKVGWVVSLSTFEHPGGHGVTRFDSVNALIKRFADPEIDLYAIIEPDTEGNEDVTKIVSDNFPADHVINGTDVNTLSTLNVIVCSRDWAVKDEVLDAIAKAVEGGVGLLRHLPLGATSGEQTDVGDKLQCVTDSEHFHEKAATECRVVSDHPLLSDVRKSLEDGKLTITSLNGAKGIVHGTPLIVLESDVSALAGLDAEGKPVEGKQATPPPDAKIFCPLFISEIGKGKVIACQWDGPPKALTKASENRFHIHCCQWLANRPIH
jgi:hypothetical protein